MRNDFYVYALLDPRKPGTYLYGNLKLDYEPFYIGKGCGKRAYSHFKVNPSKVYNSWKRRKVIRIQDITGSDPLVKLIKSDVVEAEAFRLETKAIRLIGRKGKGPLTNLTDGGEGISGFKHSKKTKVEKKHFFSNVQRQSMAKDELDNWYSNISKGHARRTPEERAALTIKHSKIQRTLPVDVDKKRRAKLSKSSKSYRSRMSASQLAIESTTLSNAQTDYWSNVSPVERQSRGDAIRKGYESKPRSEVEAKNQKIAYAIRQKHAEASQFDKRMRSFNVMVGVMLRNALNNGSVDPSIVASIKDRLKASAVKFWTEDCNLIREPKVLRERVRQVITSYA